MPDPSDILVFLYVVFWKHWVLLMLSGIPAVIEKTYEWISGKGLQFGAHLRWIIVGGAVIAVFLAWHDEYEGRLGLEKKEAVFNSAQAVLTQKEGELLTQNDFLQEKINQVRDLQAELREANKVKAELNDKIIAFSTMKSDKEKRKTIREKIGGFVFEGSQILVRCENDPNLPSKEYDDWVQRVEHFLRSNLDESFVASFRTGLTAYEPTKAPSEAHKSLWTKVYTRVEYLKEALKSL